MEAEEARARAERVADRIARLQLVTASLSEATTSERVTRVLVRQGIAALGASSGVVALLAGNGSAMDVVASVGQSDGSTQASRRLQLMADHPLAEAIRNGEAVWVGSRADLQRRYPGIAPAADTEAVAAIPLMVNGRVLGGLGLGFTKPQEFGLDERTFTLTLAQYCAQALDRSRLFEREQTAQRRLAFLAEASEILGSSLDYRRSLEKVAALAVPQVADWCTVHIVETTGAVSAVAVTHADPQQTVAARQLEDLYPVDTSAPAGIGAAIRAGRVELQAEVGEAWIRSVAADDEHARRLRDLDLRSVVVVPFVARGNSLGAISLGMTGSGRRWDLADLGLAEDLARRAATAVDISRLYDERSEVARKLQESLLPPSLPEIPGIEVDVRYRATGEGTEVGGDFYDVFATGDGAWAAVIGDVCGKGADAAGVTGLARHTIRAVAMQDRNPADILSRLNDALLTHQTERFCTVCYVRLEPRPRGARLTIASAGHPMPIVVSSHGTVQPAGVPGMPAGLFPSSDISATTVELRAGDALVLYTDGVTERRRGNRMFGEDRLFDLLSGLAGAGAGCIASRVEQEVVDFHTEPLRDDMAVLVLRIDPCD
jgi:GAF domain-containing protein